MISVPNASVSSSANGGNGGSGGDAATVEMGVTQTPRQPVLLANRPQSLPSPWADREVTGQGAGGNGGTATLSSGGLGPAVFGSSANGGTVTVSGTAIGGNGGGSVPVPTAMAHLLACSAMAA